MAVKPDLSKDDIQRLLQIAKDAHELVKFWANKEEDSQTKRDAEAFVKGSEWLTKYSIV